MVTSTDARGDTFPGGDAAPATAAAQRPAAPTYDVPRLVVAAPASGHGKTTLAIGLMAALRRRGLQVAPAKVGPDYIDPGYHLLAAGRVSRNLDPFLVGEELIAPLLLRGALTPTPADVAVIEGVMGLFDGRLGTDSFASTAHVARLTAAPVLLCVDVRHQSATVGALVHGMATYDERLTVAGVVLNQVGSARHEAEARRAIERTGLPVVGALPRAAAVEAPSRHLGLVPAAERPESRAALDALADLVADRVDLDAVFAIARRAAPLAARPWDPAAVVRPPATHGPVAEVATVAGVASPAQGTTAAGSGVRPVVAIAGGRAFTFRYAETEELLRAAGCDVAIVDPTTDAGLPAGTAGLYLGGGFPQVHATELAANAALRERVRTSVAGGLPTVAECAGLLYLCRTVDDAPMAGALPLTAAMTPKLAMGYREATAPADTLIARSGETVRGHEFHRTRTTPAPSGDPASGEDEGGAGPERPATPTGPAWCLEAGPDGASADPGHTGRPTLHAAYLHVHWAGHPQLAQRFADAVHAYAAEQATVRVDRAPAPASGTGHDGPPVPDARTTVRHPRTGASASAAGTEAAGASAASDAAATTAPPADGAPPDAVSAGASAAPAGDPASAPTVGDPGAPGPAAPSAPPLNLRHHGDRDVAPGLVDLAVNVRPTRTPPFLVDAVVADADWSAYPDAEPLRAAIAAHHGIPADHVLPTAGGAEAIMLLARALHPAYPLVVHPQFTEPDVALAAAGRVVRRHLLTARQGFRLGAADLDAAHPDADLVIIGNPTNPTSVLHPRAELLRLRRPGRILVVDEAFMDLVPGESESLIGSVRADPTGILVLRSLTKTWGIAGLRLGYVVGDPALVGRLAEQQPPWSVSTPAIRAGLAALTPPAQEWARGLAAEVAPARADLTARLHDLGLAAIGPAAAPFVLVDTAPLGPGSLRGELAARGFAVRRGETFPGLGPTWLRIAVRDPVTHAAFAAALADLARGRPTPDAAPPTGPPDAASGAGVPGPPVTVDTPAGRATSTTLPIPPDSEDPR